MPGGLRQVLQGPLVLRDRCALGRHRGHERLKRLVASEQVRELLVADPFLARRREQKRPTGLEDPEARQEALLALVEGVVERPAAVGRDENVARLGDGARDVFAEERHAHRVAIGCRSSRQARNDRHSLIHKPAGGGGMDQFVLSQGDVPTFVGRA